MNNTTGNKMTDKELMKMALEALEGADQIDIDMRDAIRARGSV